MFLVNKGRLVGLFQELARIKSPSGDEKEISRVVIEKLGELGLRVVQDSYGNIIAKLDGRGEPLILCAHLDTVAIGGDGEIKPLVQGDRIVSDGTTILGADNKDAISAIIEMLTVLSENRLRHRSLEIILTKGEEAISKGAKNLDRSLLKGKECIIADLEVDYGSIALGAPFCFNFKVEIVGRRSHVKEPEKGINAVAIAAEAIRKMPLGRITDSMTSNIGTLIAGLRGAIDRKKEKIQTLLGANCNTVPDLAIVLGEVRGTVKQQEEIENVLEEIKEIFTKVTHDAGGNIIFSFEKLADGYLFEDNDSLVSMVANTFRGQGIEPNFISSVGGSDANILNPYGIHTIVISSAYKKPHTLEEYLVIDNLVKLADFFIRVVIV